VNTGVSFPTFGLSLRAALGYPNAISRVITATAVVDPPPKAAHRTTNGNEIRESFQITEFSLSLSLSRSPGPSVRPFLSTVARCQLISRLTAITAMGGKHSKMNPMDVQVPELQNQLDRDPYLKPYEREFKRR
jgi:hypothetical protein